LIVKKRLKLYLEPTSTE